LEAAILFIFIARLLLRELEEGRLAGSAGGKEIIGSGGISGRDRPDEPGNSGLSLVPSELI
jgi:hypothetical protein